jgi:hypothetical protein
MHTVEWSPYSPTLAELKERGDNALAETRKILRDMRHHANDVRRDIVLAIHPGRTAC